MDFRALLSTVKRCDGVRFLGGVSSRNHAAFSRASERDTDGADRAGSGDRSVERGDVPRDRLEVRSEPHLLPLEVVPRLDLGPRLPDQVVRAVPAEQDARAENGGVKAL